ncbi:hypothetical protein J6590_036906 [Homalodisca vitripennis]|nr:hypothetical protein J6590_036906 [Homalodisca vitripennis]
MANNCDYTCNVFIHKLRCHASRKQLISLAGDSFDFHDTSMQLRCHASWKQLISLAGNSFDFHDTSMQLRCHASWKQLISLAGDSFDFHEIFDKFSELFSYRF